MPEVLTESFCERCGTRYTFESAVPRVARLKGLRTVSRGLKNYVMSDQTSMDEAFAAARNETDREVTSQQLDAFHKTFNFCMSCRQYTCGNCWNTAEGRCLSCAPHLGQEIMPAPFPDIDVSGGALTASGTNGHGTVQDAREEVSPLDTLAWPTADIAAGDVPVSAPTSEAAPTESDDPDAFDVMARLTGLGMPETPAPMETVEPDVEAGLQAEIEAQAEAAAIAEVEAAAAEAAAAEAAAAAESARLEAEAEQAAAAEAARLEAEAERAAEFEAARLQAEAEAAAEAARLQA